MKFDELLNDYKVKSIRKAKWADPKEHLVLPPVVDQEGAPPARGIWCKLWGYDGNAEGTYVTFDILVPLARDNEDDWEVYERF